MKQKQKLKNGDNQVSERNNKDNPLSLKEIFNTIYEDKLQLSSHCAVMHTLPIIPNWLPCQVGTTNVMPCHVIGSS